MPHSNIAEYAETSPTPGEWPRRKPMMLPVLPMMLPDLLMLLCRLCRMPRCGDTEGPALCTHWTSVVLAWACAYRFILTDCSV